MEDCRPSRTCALFICALVPSMPVMSDPSRTEAGVTSAALALLGDFVQNVRNEDAVEEGTAAIVCFHMV